MEPHKKTESDCLDWDLNTYRKRTNNALTVVAGWGLSPPEQGQIFGYRIETPSEVTSVRLLTNRLYNEDTARRAAAINEVADHLDGMFGDDLESKLAWLTQPQPELGGAIPKQSLLSCDASKRLALVLMLRDVYKKRQIAA